MASDLDLLVGTWTVQVKDWVWEYEFRAGGSLTWRDLAGPETGVGNWTAAPTLVNLSWKNSTTRESWRRPVATARNDRTWYEAPYFRGKYLVERTGGAALPVDPPPTDAAVMDKAWDASRQSLRFVAGRLRNLQQQINQSDGSAADSAHLGKRFERDIAVLSRRLIVSNDPFSAEFRDALSKALSLIEQNLALPKTITAARAGGKCADPRPAYAWTTPGRRPPDTDLCTIWFAASADIQRDVISHELFHTLGLGDIAVANTINALGNANTMAQVVAFIHDRQRQANSDGAERAVPPLPIP